MRVVIGDDSVLLREGLQLLLADDGHEVVATVGDGPSWVAAMHEHRPDLGIVDVRMPPTHTDEGLRAAVEVRRSWPGAAVFVLSQYVERSYADDLLASGTGGVGYLLKDRVFDDVSFVTSLRTVSAGGTAVDPAVVSTLLQRRTVARRLERLTTREVEVLALMAEGHANPQIAARLCVTDKAVQKHINSIFSKLDLHDAPTAARRVQAVLAYLRE